MDYKNEYYCEKCGNYIDTDEANEEGIENSAVEFKFEDRIRAFFDRVASLVL